MTVYLVQHAEALSKEEHQDRPLTDFGREDTEYVADFAAGLDVDIARIYHSGKTRAQQTAEILAEALSPAGGIEARGDIGPVDDVVQVAEDLVATGEAVMLVGHLPFMSRIISHMVVGDADVSIVNVQNAAITCLTEGDDGWQVDWILTPDMARI